MYLVIVLTKRKRNCASGIGILLNPLVATNLRSSNRSPLANMLVLDETLTKQTKQENMKLAELFEPGIFLQKLKIHRRIY